ncbi:seipin-like [Rhopilema esculentum]|uniref:seipin-like n=1 Tax=Rhopilema esculentum TaxID=499914 RepID=UPI0031DE654F|eukprot:gene2818-1047_t
MLSWLWSLRPNLSLSELPTKASSSIFSAFGWTVTTFLVFTTAFAVYAAFYVFFVPAPLHIKQVHFQFKTHGFYGDEEQSHKYHNYKEFPTATVNLKNGDSDQKSDGDMVLARGQRYKVFLVLHVPYSEENKNVGMFMTSISIKSKNNHEVGSASRSALIPFSSPVVSTLSALMDFFLLHWRWKQESERLSIMLFENFVDDSYHPSESAVITLHCKSLQVYSAELRIEAVFSGIRYYMFYWPLTAATLGISSNVVVGFLLTVWLYFKFCNEPSAQDDESEESFVIDDIMGTGFNTETESTAATVATAQQANDECVEQEPCVNADYSLTGAAVVDPPSGARRFVPARRMVHTMVSIRAQNQRRVPPVSLTRRLQSAKELKDGFCQTEPVEGYMLGKAATSTKAVKAD